MTQEDKAKAYDIALDKIKRLLGTGSNCSREDIEYVFPELKESENERIRKVLKEYFINSFQINGVAAICGVHIKDIIAWLEKQGEKTNPYSGISFEYNGHVWGMCARDNGVDILLDKQLFKHLEKQGEQKFAWGYEDERNLDWLTTVCERIYYKSDPQVSSESALMLKEWLISLKDRVQPQTRQEWSEEDRETIDYLIDYLESELDSSYTDLDKETFTKEINLLKSLRPQSQWKPTDEQIEALSHMIDAVESEWACEETIGRELLKQLKKLRGE